MQITIKIPDNLSARMEKKWGNLSQKLLINLVLEAYQNHLISTAEVGQIMNHSSRIETHDFLKKEGIYLNYDEIEMQHDLAIVEELRD